MFRRTVAQIGRTVLNSTSRRCFVPEQKQFLASHLKECDPEIFGIIEKEKIRQRDSLVLIPSENFTSVAVLEALGSIMQNKYSEGYPGARYYGGNEFIDMAERACQQRALEAFNLDPEKWGVNVQSLSGSPANFAVYNALLQPHDRIMSLDLPHGGHLSHGYSTPTKKISAVSVYWEVLPYRLNEETGYIDYDTLAKNAVLYRPKLVVAGASAYSRFIDYQRMKQVCDSVDAYLVSDMAHISGLVAAGVIPSPFDHSDIVTTTTHKSLRGPRGAMIFFRKGVRRTDKKGAAVMYDLENRINASVFPGLQGGPHNHTITALAVALKQANSDLFRTYAKQVLANSQALTSTLMRHQYKIVSGGTDNHLALVDLRNKNVDGAKVERIAELANIALNKNTVPGDKSAMVPGGIRIGSPAMTSRGLLEKDFEQIGEFLHETIQIALRVQKAAGSNKLQDFRDTLKNNSFPEINQLKDEVTSFCRKFPTVGF
eukprot:TRINITY_DN438_c0_g1_i1.p1 TRINITY_DN438_c0_g1~~TRINITY_DN438_c0_g1_i1.p1  ORF type:complete len:486 (-),score=187.44 TRINITY_DN438_c0_g1_i1:100-1557(-)